MKARSPRPRPQPALQRVADVQLRGRTGPLATRVYWPAPPESGLRPALLVLFPAGGSVAEGLDRADAVCRAVCRYVRVVVLAVSHRPAGQRFQAAALEDALTATGWAADHAAELGADPGRLLVAGEAAGGRLAAAVALHARDDGWPPVTRQVLIRPELGAGHASSPRGGRDRHALPLEASSLKGVAAATVVTADHGPRFDDGRKYAALLRHAGVDVDELRDDGLPHDGASAPAGSPAERVVRDLARSLRRTLDAPPVEPGPHTDVPT
ncbi:MAG TPA: alpha/beta hydrolase fold domain-containing protein [Acidimicrobiales bacterium]